MQKIGGNYFPFLVAMDAEGKTLGNPSVRSVDGFRAHMKFAKDYVDSRAKAAKGDANAKLDFFIAQLKMGEFKDLDEAKNQLAALKKPSKEQQAEIDGLLTGLEVHKIAEAYLKNRDRSKIKELGLPAGKKFAEMDKAGRVPAQRDDFGLFYSLILIYAEEEKDIPLFEKSLNALIEKFGKDIRQDFVRGKEAILERMKEEKAEKEPSKEPK